MDGVWIMSFNTYDPTITIFATRDEALTAVEGVRANWRTRGIKDVEYGLDRINLEFVKFGDTWDAGR